MDVLRDNVPEQHITTGEDLIWPATLPYAMGRLLLNNPDLDEQMHPSHRGNIHALMEVSMSEDGHSVLQVRFPFSRDVLDMHVADPDQDLPFAPRINGVKVGVDDIGTVDVRTHLRGFSDTAMRIDDRLSDARAFQFVEGGRDLHVMIDSKVEKTIINSLLAVASVSLKMWSEDLEGFAN